jgi:hypothetical protein
MVQFKWSADKNRLLRQNNSRAVCFEDIVSAIENGGLLDDIEHENAAKYPHQRMYIVLYDNYIYAVPYVRDEEGVFLKTVYPSRKFTGIYLKGNGDED